MPFSHGEIERGLMESVSPISSNSPPVSPLFLNQHAHHHHENLAHDTEHIAAHAILTCPGGPTVRTYIGRRDSATANPPGLMPNVNARADDIVALFERKGIPAHELAALMGAHTASRQFAFDARRSGQPLDGTPGVWDVRFYGEALEGGAPYTLPSDAALVRHRDVGNVVRGFVNNQGRWNQAFSPA